MMDLCAQEHRRHRLDVDMTPDPNGMIGLNIYDHDTEESRMFIIDGEAMRHWYESGPASHEFMDAEHYDVLRISIVNHMFHFSMFWLWRKEFDLRGRVNEFELDNQEFIQVVFNGKELHKTCVNEYLARDLDVDDEW